MTYFAVDDRVPFHAKIIRAGNEAIGAWARAGAWSAGNLTDGYIPADVAATIAPERVWRRLEEARSRPDGVGLAEAAPGGWLLHDFLDCNPSREQVLAKRSARAEAGRAGGARSGAARRSTREAIASPVAAPSDSANAKQEPEQTPKQNEALIPIPIPEDLSPPAGARVREEGPPESGTSPLGALPPVGSPLPPELRERVDALSLSSGEQIDAETQWARFLGHYHERKIPTHDVAASWAKWLGNAPKFAKRERGLDRAAAPSLAPRSGRVPIQSYEPDAPWLRGAGAGGARR